MRRLLDLRESGDRSRGMSRASNVMRHARASHPIRLKGGSQMRFT